MKVTTEERIELTNAIIDDSFDDFIDNFYRVLKKKGRGSFVNYLECAAKMTEEYMEVLDAVHRKNKTDILAELKDLANVCILGIMTLENKD